MSVRLMITVLAFALGAAWLPAQQQIDFEEDLDFDRPEAWAMKYFTSAMLLTSLGAPDRTEPGSFDLGLEVTWLPRVSTEDRRIGFNGTKVEDLNKTPGFARPRFIVGLPHDFTLTVAYVPPVKVLGVKPHVFSAGVGRPLFRTSGWRFGSRLYAHWGELEGDLTCDSDTVDAGNDPVKNPYGCLEESKDVITQVYTGIDFGGSWEVSDRFEPHFSVAVNYLDMEFQVNSRYGNFDDRSLLKADGFTYYATAGLGYRMTDRIGLAAEIFYSPLWVDRPQGENISRQNDGLLHVRALATYKLK